MLIPKEKVYMKQSKTGVSYCLKYHVYDTDKKEFVENVIFSSPYDTAEECQKEIDFVNGFRLVRAS